MDRTERFYRIDALLRERRVVPVATFLAELEVSRATFKRDLEYLRDRLHAPIVWDPQARGYRFEEPPPGAPRYSLPGLWLSEPEVRSLFVLHELLKHIHPGLLGPRLEPVMERARALLGEGEDADAAAEVARRIRILHMPRREVRTAEFATVSQALLARRRLRIEHYHRWRDESTERVVSPQRLVHYRDNWYLDAWCHLRRGLRSFSMDCVRQAHIEPQAAREEEDAVLDRELGAGYGIFAGGKVRTARLRFSRKQARWVADEVWHSAQRGEFDADGRYVLEVPYTHSDELVMNVLKFGADAEVLAPASLRAEVRDALRAAVGQYGEEPVPEERVEPHEEE